MPFDFDLSGDEFSEFQDALDHAFLDYEDLGILTRRTFGTPIAKISAPDRNPVVIGKILSWAEAEGQLDALLKGALERRPGNPYLKRLGQRYIVTAPAPSSGLQSIVMQNVPFVGNPTAYLEEFGSRMQQAADCVGRFEIPLQTAAGTGFLVAADIALTNWHVAKLISERGKTSSQCGLRLHYRKDRAGITSDGNFVALAETDWLLDSAPEEKLDYALVRLSQRVGEGKNWLKPQAHAFQRDEPLFILQHPNGEPLIVQAGSVAGVDSLLHRITYTTNTAGGSSGSPCFTSVWELVALHNWGQSVNNAGYTMEAIQKNVRATKPQLADELGW